MEILVIGQLPPPVHGSNVMTERLISTLERIGYKPLIVQKSFSLRVEDVDRFSFKKVIQVPLILNRLIRQTRGNNVKLCVFFLSLGPMSFLFDASILMILRLWKIPYLLYIHGIGVHKLGTVSGRLCKWMVNASIPFASGAFILGELIKPDILPYVSEDRLYVLPNTLDVEKCGGIPIRSVPEKTKILFLSNIRQEKGVWEYLRVAKEIANKCPEVEFLLAGPCQSRQMQGDIRHFIERHRLSGQVQIIGPIYGDEKEKLFRNSDIFLFPSHQEAFPLVVLEAMQWGLPVVASDVGCIPEIVVNGETGYIVDHTNIGRMSECVAELVSDPWKRRAMGNAGHERVSRLYTLSTYRAELTRGLSRFLERTTTPEGY